MFILIDHECKYLYLPLYIYIFERIALVLCMWRSYRQYISMLTGSSFYIKYMGWGSWRGGHFSFLTYFYLIHVNANLFSFMECFCTYNNRPYYGSLVPAHLALKYKMHYYMFNDNKSTLILNLYRYETRYRETCCANYESYPHCYRKL